MAMDKSLRLRGTAFAALRWCMPLACLWLQACDSGAGTVVTDPPPPIDTTAPTIPGTPTATAINSTRIDLTWAASTDAVGVTGYRIFRNGSATALATAT